MTAPLRAATVLCLRPAARDVEVLLVRRGARSSFMANAFVFPGGRVDAEDSAGQIELGTRRCAARELCEEVNLRIADLAELVYFARWVTPSREPKRFDTDFFLWALPPDQTPQVDAQEVFDLRFYTPRAALAEYEAGKLNLPPPTACTLEDLGAEIAQVADASPLLPALLRSCAARRPHTLKPRLRVAQAGDLEIVMPWDPEFPSIDGEGEPVPGRAEGAAAVSERICRCTLTPPGVWRIQRLPPDAP